MSDWCGDNPVLVCIISDCIRRAIYAGGDIDPVCFLEELDDEGWTVIPKNVAGKHD